MGVHLLSPFLRMIDRIPVGAIVRAARREEQMLVDDLARGRTFLDDEAISILSFCHFLEAARSGVKIPPVALPMEDTAFYRKTTEKLVKAGELPGAAREQFEDVFAKPVLRLSSSPA